MKNCKSYTSKGYTMIEVMVVVVIMGIMAALGGPELLSWLRNEKVRSAASEMTSAWMHARSLAVANSIEYRVVVDTSNKTVSIEKGDSYSSSSTWTAVRPAIELSNDVGITVFLSTASGITKAFPPDGILIYSPSGTVLDTNGAMVNSNSYVEVTSPMRYFRAIVVSPRTGQIKLAGPYIIS